AGEMAAALGRGFTDLTAEERPCLTWVRSSSPERRAVWAAWGVPWSSCCAGATFPAPRWSVARTHAPTRCGPSAPRSLSATSRGRGTSRGPWRAAGLYFGLSASAVYLEATVTAAAVARARGDLEVFVNMSQMTVSQMSLT